MKRELQRILLLMVIVCLCITRTGAQNLDYDFEVDGICYKITSDSEFTVGVSYKGSNDNGYIGDVVIPEHIIHEGQTYSVTSIRDEAFKFSRNMTSITIPDSVTSIGICAFEYCSGLISITIPNSVTNIGDKVFKHCSGLISIHIGNGVTNIGEDAFYYCTRLASVTIGTSVTCLEKCAFVGCESLTSIIIPNSVKEIGERAFSGCSALTSVLIGNSVTHIGAYAFYGCKELTSITIPKFMERIANNAFDNCTGLTTVVIGNPAPVIDHVAFNKCTGLTDVYCLSKTVPAIGVGSFPTSIAKNATLHVPESSLESYKKAATWKEFGTIIPLPLFTLTYKVDGTEYKKVELEYGASIADETEPTKEGHTFSGWSEIPETMPAQDVAVEGTFTVNRYKVTYMVDGEEYASDSIAYGEAIELKDMPVKDGYVFSGWSKVPETMPAQDVTVTGSFTVDGIDAVACDKFVDVYTLQGVMVKQQVDIDEVKNGLPKGLYIVNGKKMVIR